MTTPQAPRPERPPKATLFCAVCGHASPPDGDWERSLTTTELGERLTLSCPDCDATLTRRPAEEARAERGVCAD